MNTSPVTAAEARHSEDYSPACDLLLAFTERGYKGTHAYYGRHADEWSFESEEAAFAIWMLQHDPLIAWPRHRVREVAA